MVLLYDALCVFSAECVCIYFKYLKPMHKFSVFFIKAWIKVHRGCRYIFLGAKNFFLSILWDALSVSVAFMLTGDHFLYFMFFMALEKGVSFLDTLVVASGQDVK